MLTKKAEKILKKKQNDVLTFFMNCGIIAI